MSCQANNIENRILLKHGLYGEDNDDDGQITYSGPVNHAGKYRANIISMLLVIVIAYKINVNW